MSISAPLRSMSNQRIKHHGKCKFDDGIYATFRHRGLAGHSGAPPQGGEPGIHTPRPVVMDSGLAALAAPRNDAAYDSKSLNPALSSRIHEFDVGWPPQIPRPLRRIP